jgi:ribosome-binding factor A
MSPHRTERVGELIHHQISLMLDREISDPRLSSITVIRVEMSGDLRIAKVYLASRDKSAEMNEKEIKDALAHASGYFRRQVAQTVDLRYAPEIRFYIDHSIEMGEHFLQVLEQVEEEEKERKKRVRRR